MQTNRVVYLKEYPKFWQRLQVVIHKQQYASAASAERIMQEEFGIDVEIRSTDKTGTVMMNEATYTWFVMQWS